LNPVMTMVGRLWCSPAREMNFSSNFCNCCSIVGYSKLTSVVWMDCVSD
jgi:hypothetical protein